MKRKKINITNFLGGLNSQANAFQLQGSELSETNNLRITDFGNAKSRTGNSKHNSATIEASKYVTALHQYIDSSGNRTQYAICGQKIYDWTSSTPAELSDALSATKTLSENQRASVFTWKNNMFISNGEEPAFEFGEQTLYARDKAYVCDSNNHRIQYFNSVGAYQGQWGSSGSGNGEFNYPYGIAIDETNSKVYVADHYNNRIQKFDLNGNYELQWGIGTPYGIAVDETNSKVYVVSTDGYVIRYYDLDGIYVGQWGGFGSGNGQFDRPRGIAVDETNSKVYVADTDNQRIQKFDLNGNYELQWGSAGNGNGQFNRPRGIAVDETNSKVYVADAFNHRIQYFDIATHSYQGQWGSSGNGNGQFNYPQGIALKLSGEGGANVFHDLATPLSLKAANSGNAGNPDGTYKYKITYFDGTHESSGGIESNEVTVATNQVSLTNISVSPMDTVTKRYIYRTKTGGSVYYYVGSINDNDIASTTFDDNVADASLGDALPTVNNLIPTFEFLIQFKDFLFGAGDYNNPNNVYWTNSLDANDWKSTNELTIGEDEGTIITGLKVLGDYIIVFKEDSIWYLNVAAETDLVDVFPHHITSEYGCVSNYSIDEATIDGQQGLIFADKDNGICFLSANQVKSLSEKVIDDWRGFSKSYLGNAYGKFYPELAEYWLSLTASGSTNNQVWIYNIKNKTTYKPYSMNVCSFGKATISGVENLYSGDFNGFIYKQNDTEADAGAAIDAYMTTGWLNANTPAESKIFDTIIIDYIEKGSWNATVYWAVDGASFSAANSVNISLSGTSGNRNKYKKRLPSVIGRTIKIRIRNENASEPFEICGIYLDVRVRKSYIG